MNTIQLTFALLKGKKLPLCCDEKYVVIELYDSSITKSGEAYLRGKIEAYTTEGNYIHYVISYDISRLATGCLHPEDVKSVRCEEKNLVSVNGKIYTETAPINCADVKKCETVTTLIKNEDGSYTYTNEIGQDTTFFPTIEDVDNEGNPVTFYVKGSELGDVPQAINPSDTLFLQGQNFILTKAIDLDTVQIKFDTSGAEPHEFFGADADGNVGWFKPIVFTETCGLKGLGTCGNKLSLNLPSPLTYTLPCAKELGDPVYCDDEGQLRVPSSQKVIHGYISYEGEDCVTHNLPIPTGPIGTMLDSGIDLTFNLTNPDLCRTMHVHGEYRGWGTIRLEAGQNIDLQAFCSKDGEPLIMCNTEGTYFTNTDFQGSIDIIAPFDVDIPPGGIVTLKFKTMIKYNNNFTNTGWAEWINECAFYRFIGVSE